MEILNTIPGGHDWFAIIIGAVLIVLAIGLIYVSVFELYLVGFLLSILLAYGGYALIFVEGIDGIITQYEVKITDYNEVYEQGYEIVEQRGDIAVVQKVEGEAN
jgi:hypothetical protein